MERATFSNMAIYCLYLMLSCFILNGCHKEEVPENSSGTFSPDSLQAYPGHNRVALSWKLTDPQVKKAVVYWTGTDSAIYTYYGRTDTMMVYIPGLSDANYSFRVYLRDDAGRTVSQGKVVARAYGERYLQSLQPWSNEASFHDGNVTVRWGASQRTVAGAEIRYSKDDGTAVALRVQPDAETTVLSDYKPGSFFAYRTLYLPVQEAIDTFYTAYKTVPVISGRLKDLAEEKNILIGSLISYGNPWANSHGVIQDGSPGNIYTQLARDEFNLGQATWGAAWGGWNDENVYDFNGVNAVINWCLSNHQTVMVHNILGNNTYMPDWFINGSYTPKQMEVMLQNLVSHFMESNNNKSKVAIWDVVNEAFSDQNGTYRDMKWNDMGWEDDASGLPADQVINVKHPVFIGKALEYCRQKTNAKLEIRD